MSYTTKDSTFDIVAVRANETMPKALARHRRETGRRGFVFYRFEGPRTSRRAHELRAS